MAVYLTQCAATHLRIVQMKLAGIRKRVKRIIGSLYRKSVGKKSRPQAALVMAASISYPAPKDEQAKSQFALTSDDQRALKRLVADMDMRDRSRNMLQHLAAVERAMSQGGLKFVLGCTDTMLHRAHLQLNSLYFGDTPPAELMSLAIILEAGSLRYDRAAYMDPSSPEVLTIDAFKPGVTRSRPARTGDTFTKTQPAFLDTAPISRP